MPTNRRRRTRTSGPSLEEQGYIFFGPCDFFDEAPDFAALPEAERRAFWLANRAAIIARYHREHPEDHDRTTWGETLEAIEAGHADKP